ncbi:hypothetical protein LUZ60_001476 [Juncus effusus]|nr:hypothetical protein LUZ60_001476 [Juncus effusus]
MASAAAVPSNDAESLFRAKKIPEIRSIHKSTLHEIDRKTDELRLLVGRSYRDLIDSADSILLIHSSSQSISSTLTSISSSLQSLSGPPKSHHSLPKNPNRSRLYSIAARVKYVVDTPEHIWGCLDDPESSMLLEASGRYLRARQVHSLLQKSPDLDKFPLLRHQWQIVRSFRSQISQRSRERLSDQGLNLASYADALAAVAVIDDLNPKKVLSIFLDSRKSWISQKISKISSDPDLKCSAVLCDVAKVIRMSLGQAGQMFLTALNETPLFYKTVLGSSPGAQYFGGIPNPEEEVRLWKEHMEALESTMVLLEHELVASSCASWLKECCKEIFGGGVKLINGVLNGEGLGKSERLLKGVLDGREDLEESLESWLKSVFGFGSDNESPWDQIRGLILKEEKDIFEGKLEEALVKRMKEIVDLEFENLSKSVDLRDLIEGIGTKDGEMSDDFRVYLKKGFVDGGVWFSEIKQSRGGILANLNLKIISDESDFKSCLNLYFGPEVTKIRDEIDNKCKGILEDVLSFIESNNSSSRLKDLVPFLQEKCYNTISAILKDLEGELVKLASLLENYKEGDPLKPALIVERSLFIGRILFALRYHSSNIPLILGTPRQWIRDSNINNNNTPKSSSFTPKRYSFESPRSPNRVFGENPNFRRQTLAAAAALFGSDYRSNPRLDELNKTLQSLCIKAHNVWINWVSNELSIILSHDLDKDDSLSASTPLRGWDVTMIKQESSEGPLELQIALPSMPSVYVISFFYQACLEIHRIGGHILDRIILQNFAYQLLDKVVKIYENFFAKTESGKSRVSEKGLLQILLDLRFIGDVLSGSKNPKSDGSESNPKSDQLSQVTTKSAFRRRQSHHLQSESSPVIIPVTNLISKFSARLDPIDWATYEPYLWENEKQSYMSYVVLFGFLVQLNRLYTDVVQKSPKTSNTDLNIMRCSQVPRFKYLPISAPALSTRAAQNKSAGQVASDEASSRSPYRSFSTGDRSPKSDFDDSESFAAPSLMSFMTQVGSKFGESTSRLGSMLSDGGQVSRLKDRSLSSFGDILPGSGIFSSLTSGARFDS